MPILKSRMKALKKQYGEKEGEAIYNKMESEGKNRRIEKPSVKSKKKIFK